MITKLLFSKATCKQKGYTKAICLQTIMQRVRDEMHTDLRLENCLSSMDYTKQAVLIDLKKHYFTLLFITLFHGMKIWGAWNGLLWS